MLTQAEIDSAFWGADPARVDYGALYQNRLAVLSIACHRGWERDVEAVAPFSAENRNWLPDYALFMALKQPFWRKAVDALAGGHSPSPEGSGGTVSEGCCQRMWRCLPIFSFCFSGSGTCSVPMPRSRGFGLSAICRFMWPWTPPTCGRSPNNFQLDAQLTPTGGGRRAAGLFLPPTGSCGAIPCTTGTP